MAAASKLPAIEQRSFSEVRSNGRRLEDYAATFGSEATIGRIVETIAAGAFREALAGDVLALLDHDAGKVLGRTRSGTLRLTEDSKGLAFSLDVPDTQAGRDVLALALSCRRGRPIPTLNWLSGPRRWRKGATYASGG